MTAPSGPAPIVVVGDTLLDVDVEGEADRLAPDAPVPVICRHTEHRRPGGAGLAGLLAARDGAPVVLITAIGDDEAGRYLRGLLTEHLELIRLPLRGTTVSKTRVRARGQTLLRIDGGDGHARRRANGAANRPEMEEALALASRALERAGAVLVSDYGRGVAEVMREHLRDLAVPLVWDPHPHGPKPVPECALVTPSEAEARLLCSEPYMTADLAARQLVRALGAEAVAVTLGAGGAALARRGGKSVRVPAPGVAAGSDACGAGDRFAGAAALALRDGEPVEDAVAQAVGEATRFVEAGGAAATRFGETGAHRFGAGRGGTITAAVPSLGDRPRSAEEVAELVHGTGGRLIATGGCFDLLHAGHVSLLRRARALGDALIVCVNSDESVRRLKGAGRPVVPVEDRVEVLRGLSCVDAVLVFDDDTPVAPIAQLRPHVWVKGGDYGGTELPESEVVRRGGGEIVFLPVVPGRSTTSLISAAQSIS